MLFYFWGEKYLIWIIIASTSIDFFCALIIANGFKPGKLKKLGRGTPRSFIQKSALIISILSNLAFLGYFKYFNFFIENYISFTASMGWENSSLIGLSRVALPLGISFYTFQSMSYTIDVYRGEVAASKNIWNFACYVTMFPQLVAGPIVRYRDIENQLTDHKINYIDFGGGVKRFIFGLAKKVIIANTMAGIANPIFNLPFAELDFQIAWLGIICYALQIYFDFSGYSDMAIGMGHMLGFKFKENFNYPYISCSIREFWQRWHISLSTWLRDYLYIPLGGSRQSPLKNYFNLFIVFFLCGLWHGASWNFIIWGFIHGIFIVFERLWLSKPLKKIPEIFAQAYVLLVVLIGWVFFRSETLANACSYLKIMFTGGEDSSATSIPIGYYLQPTAVIILVSGIILSLPTYKYIISCTKNILASKKNTFFRVAINIFVIIFIFALFLYSTIILYIGSYNPFIYFRF